MEMESLMSALGESNFAWALSLLAIGICCSFFTLRARGLPPGPFCWPIVGCLFSLQRPIHHYYAELAKRYGPVIYLKIGTVPQVVVSSSDMAKEVLKIHDLEFANRPPDAYMKDFSFDYNDMLYASYGESWRKLRKVSITHLFSPPRLNATACFRKSEMAAAIKSVLHSCEAGCLVNVSRVVAELISNALCLTLFGKKIGSTGPDSGRNPVVQLVFQILKETSFEANISTLIPALHWLDLHGMQRRRKHELMPQLKSLLSELIEEHRQHKAQVEAMNQEFECKDFTDVLISMEKDDALSDISIMALLTDMVVAGLETSRVTVECVMVQLMNNPQLMLKAQEEIDKVVGKIRFVQESDLPNLPYIQAIVKEILRLHPAAPLGAAHFNLNAATIAGYKIPAKCRVHVNIWAIGRDPKHWSQPEEFKPERFLGSELTVTGQHFELIPFSAGRRICAGIPLALRSISFVVAALLQAFDWSNPPGQESLSVKLFSDVIAGVKLSSDLIAAASPRLNESTYACI